MSGKQSGLSAVLASKTGGLGAALDQAAATGMPGLGPNMTGAAQLAQFKFQSESYIKEINELKEKVGQQAAHIVQLEDQLRAAPAEAGNQAELQARLEQEKAALQDAELQLRAQLGVLEQALEEAKKGFSLYLPFDKIVKIPGRKRNKSQEEYEELQANIRAHGISSYPVVIELGDGRYELVNGYNRVEILTADGHEGTVFQVSTQPHWKAKELAFFDNLVVNALSHFEKYLRLIEIQQDHDPELPTHRALANYVGMKENRVSDLMVYGKLPPEVIELLKKCYYAVNLEAAAELEKLVRRGRKEQVISAVRAAVEAGGKMQQAEILRRASGAGTADAHPSEPEWFKAGERKLFSLKSRTNSYSLTLQKGVDRGAFEAALRAALAAFAADQAN